MEHHLKRTKDPPSESNETTFNAERANIITASLQWAPQIKLK